MVSEAKIVGRSINSQNRVNVTTKRTVDSGFSGMIVPFEVPWQIVRDSCLLSGVIMSVLESINPATGETCWNSCEYAVDEIPQVVAEARAAQPAWAALGVEGRRKRLVGAAERMIESADRVGRILTQEMGKPLKSGVGEVKSCGKTLVEELDEMVRAFTLTLSKTPGRGLQCPMIRWASVRSLLHGTFRSRCLIG